MCIKGIVAMNFQAIVNNRLLLVPLSRILLQLFSICAMKIITIQAKSIVI